MVPQNWGPLTSLKNFKMFKERMELCIADNGVTDDGRKAVQVKIAVGSEGLRRLNAIDPSDDQKKTSELWKLITAKQSELSCA